jgi:hypothetical protein
MLLVQLPPELLLAIFNFLGPEFFREDISRLTVSRWWYDGFAWPTLVGNLELTAKATAFTGGEALESLQEFTRDETLILRAQPHITALSLSLINFKLGSNGQHRPDAQADAELDEWVVTTKSSLAKLAANLPHCPHLQHLKLLVRARHGWYPLADTLVDLFSAGQLTSLHLDAAGSFRVVGSRDREVGEDHSSTHFCPSINALFPSLRRLHYHMDSVCERLLEIPEEGTFPHLDEVIIDITRYERLLPFPASLRWSRRCRHIPGDVPYLLRDDLERAATRLASRLRNPRMVKVRWHGMFTPEA